jgi:hypothetical protein
VVAAAAILIFIAGYFWNKRSNHGKKEDNPPPLPKEPEIRVNSDAGRQSVDSSREVDIDHEIQLRFFPDPGSQIVEKGSILHETIAEEEM